jgi:hypothetical protein
MSKIHTHAHTHSLIHKQTKQKVFEEAELCLSDLHEAVPGTEDYIEECACAKGAVNNAFTAYVDLLEDLRRANPEQLQSYSEVRNTNACNLKRLRQELDEAIQHKQQSPK